MKCTICNLRLVEAGETVCVQCEQAADFIASAPAESYVSPLIPPKRFEASVSDCLGVATPDVEEVETTVIATEPKKPLDLPAHMLCKECGKDQRVTRGLCISCYRKHRDAGTLPDMAPEAKRNGSVAPPPKPSADPKHCFEAGCDEKAYCKGRCKTHYARWRYKERSKGNTGRAVESDPTPKKKPAVVGMSLKDIREAAQAERDAAVAKAEARYKLVMDAVALLEGFAPCVF